MHAGEYSLDDIEKHFSSLKRDRGHDDIPPGSTAVAPEAPKASEKASK